MIPRFYDATKGLVRYHGRPIGEYPLEELRRNIGVVPQKAVLFKGTIESNLRWGNENATLEEMEEIAQAEIENAKASIPLLEMGSRLGWEPSMEYIGTPDRILWKEKIIQYILNGEVKWYKEAVKYDL